MVWDKDILPYLWYWQGTGGGFGQPFYGRVYTIAIEPWSSYPDDLSKAYHAGTTIKLKPGERLNLSLKAVAYSGIERFRV